MRLARIAVVLCLGVVGIGAGGCALSPWDPDTAPVIDDFESRITAGTGTTVAYHDALRVEPGSTVQFRTKIGDGNAVIYTIPTDPAPAVEIGVHAEDDAADEQTIELTGADGEEITVGNPTAFTPGYLGVEHHEEPGELTLRVIAPRLTGTPQGQARFSFKLDVGAAPGG